MLFNKVSYRRGIIEGVIIYAIGRLGALITPAVFPDWMFVAVPLLFLVFQYILPPVWAARRMTSTKRERLSKRFWLLGPRIAAICLGLDIIISLCCGLPLTMFEVQQGPALLRLFARGASHLTLTGYLFYELRTAVFLFVFYTIAVVCTRLAGGGFLRFTMPAGGNRVTL
ncbi:hypothetical protein [Dictyobacter aurantiacus]|uniref:Uncharacterized protein n=1 Tax=Dictyobacter aurantiacus TaxID=1936993 RepID=A0A401ZDJ5_9CHLR|nr:hypothetical protein [Dictyobacter aurantiacus]GCE04947.1 hypothetical protein KDAU_22760 [Dictyobacter aurantiacus]